MYIEQRAVPDINTTETLLIPVRKPLLVPPYATLTVRIPDPSDIHDYTPNSGEYLWRKPDGSVIDLVVSMRMNDPGLKSWHSLHGNPVHTITERIQQVLTWIHDAGVFNGR